MQKYLGFITDIYPVICDMRHTFTILQQKKSNEYIMIHDFPLEYFFASRSNLSLELDTRKKSKIHGSHRQALTLLVGRICFPSQSIIFYLLLKSRLEQIASEITHTHARNKHKKPFHNKSNSRTDQQQHPNQPQQPNQTNPSQTSPKQPQHLHRRDDRDCNAMSSPMDLPAPPHLGA